MGGDNSYQYAHCVRFQFSEDWLSVTGWEAGKIGRMEGRALHRLNCDFCDSRIYRIGSSGWQGEDWKAGGISNYLKQDLQDSKDFSGLENPL